jgi:hypothetical protein
MIDTEVMRLRRLRNTVLRARALAGVLDPDPARRNSTIFSRSAVSCWRISCVITGWLRAHPYLSYQQGPSEMRGFYDRLSTGLLGAVARYHGRSPQTFSTELQRVARGLDDARALTWSSELSDTLGRAQMQIRSLIQELNADAHKERASRDATTARVDMRVGNGRDGASSVAGDWPYLAI